MLCRSEQPPSLNKTDKTCSSFPSSSLELTLLLVQNPEPPLASALLSMCFMNAQELAPFWESFITTSCWVNAKPVKMQGEEIQFLLFYRKEQSPGPTGFLVPSSVAWADQLQWLTPATKGPIPGTEPRAIWRSCYDRGNSKYKGSPGFCECIFWPLDKTAVFRSRRNTGSLPTW